MIAPSARFRIRTPGVVSDVIDGETIAIDLDSGDYYSLPGVASDIWGLVRRGLPVGRIAEAIRAAYDGDPSAIEAGVVRFLLRLRDAGLVVPDEGDGPDVDTPALEAAGARRPFEPPVLETYTDMREFLLVDPIHEVDVTDWPHVRPRGDAG